MTTTRTSLAIMAAGFAVLLLAATAAASVSSLAWRQPNRSAQIFQKAYYVNVAKDRTGRYVLRRFVCAPRASSRIVCVGTLYVLGSPFPLTVTVQKISTKMLQWNTQVGSMGRSTHTAPLSSYPGMG